MAKVNTVTVVVNRDGGLHVCVRNMSNEDAARWAELNYQVFKIAAAGGHWAVQHVNSGWAMDSGGPARQAAAPGEPMEAEFLLPLKKGGTDDGN